MIGYLDLPSGISGDMLLGCLIDAGWAIEQLRQTIQRLRLPSEDWAVEARPVTRGALRATLANVRVTEARAHRHLHHVRKIIDGSDLPIGVRQRAAAVFVRLAQAEARVHGTTIEKIHFHEVGALDAIVDIVGVVMGVHELGIERLYASALPMGHGWIDSAHGKLPLPAPATVEILSQVGAPTHPAPGEGELVTPTGAALIAELAKFEQPAMRLHRIALGAGQRETAWPNVARLWLGEADSDEQASQGSIVQIETNIDDMNPQLYSPLTERLLAAGALDVWLTPIQMKKGRPGVVLGVLAPLVAERTVADLILRETTTLGVRVCPVRRYEADRDVKTVQTPFGTVCVKLKRWGGEVMGAMPEYEDCRRIAEARSIPVRVVYEAALAGAQRLAAGESGRASPHISSAAHLGGRRE